MVIEEEVQPKYQVNPLLWMDKEDVRSYFQALEWADTLKYRFSDIIDPVLLDALEVIERMGKQMYIITSDADNYTKPLAEFTLENITGKAIQSHFSTHPAITTKERIAIGRHAAEHALTRKHPKTGEYFFDALFGLTPLTNRAACIYALKIGYKKQGTLHHAMMVQGAPEDCMISVCTRESFNGK